MPSAYALFKVVHILSVVIFLGNIITGLFWKAHADGTGDRSIMAHTLRGIIRSDRLFTLPGVAGVIAGGVGAAMKGGFPILGVGWIAWPVLLFALSGIVFAVRVAPLQRQLLALASPEGGDLDRVLYRRLSVRWEIWGAVALVTPLAAAVIMVWKPPLPGF